MAHMFRLQTFMALTAVVMVACGGGGGAGTSAAPSSLVNGTAATGAAIAGGKVTLKCQNGTSTIATTGTDGGFSIDVTVIGLPCVGRVDYTDSKGAAQKLHTIITAAGTANITPVTDLLVANLTGAVAADAFDKFDAAKTKAFTAVQIKTASDAVKNYLKTTLGLDTAALPTDLVGTKFVPKVGGTAGDAADQVLDALQAKLAALGKSLVDIGGEVAKGASVTPVATGSAVGKGIYLNVTAENNAAFLALLASKCVKDSVLSDAEHDVYKNCTHSNLDPAPTSLINNMYRGALPNDGTIKNAGGFVIPISGPGLASVATVQSQVGMTGVTVGQSCKVNIVEPFIPFIALKTNDADNYQAGGSAAFADRFNFRGSASDTIYVTPGGVVLQYNMTDSAGKKLSVQINTSTGKTSASVGNFESGTFWTCE